MTDVLCPEVEAQEETLIALAEYYGLDLEGPHQTSHIEGLVIFNSPVIRDGTFGKRLDHEGTDFFKRLIHCLVGS